MQILIAEDEKALCSAVKKILEQHGYLVDAVYNGIDALEYAKSVDYELIILDVMMPGLDGFEVVRRLRSEKINAPVLMLTARTATSDKVTGLNSGADDYLTKPFETEELVARVGALTRRRGDVVIDSVTYRDLSLDLHSALLSHGEDSVQLSHKEFEVLKIFLYNPDMTVTTETLINKVWGFDSDATDNNVEVYVSFLRKKLRYLKSAVTVRKIQKIGYRLEDA